MCLRFVFLLITRTVTWLRLSRREEAWRIAEILILRHQFTVLPRRQPCRPELNWADRALLATLLGVIPRARRDGVVAENLIHAGEVACPQQHSRSSWQQRTVHVRGTHPAG